MSGPARHRGISNPAQSGGATTATPGKAAKRCPTGTVTIDIERCKGCELCIAACPPQVLSMSSALNEAGFRYPELSEGCTGCTACQLVCPDYVFAVYRLPLQP